MFVKCYAFADNVKLLTSNIQKPDSAGESYSSQAYVVDLKVEVDSGVEKEMRWFIKLPLDDEEKIKIHRQMFIEQKEITLYSEVGAIYTFKLEP